MDQIDDVDPLELVFPEDLGVTAMVSGTVTASAPRAAHAVAHEPAIRLAPAIFPVDPLCGPVFRDFEQAGVRWCLLGLPEGSRDPRGLREEVVTALIDPPALGTANRILRTHGFAAVPVWDQPREGAQRVPQGEGAHRFVGYNPKSDCWVTLLLVTRLAYGPFAALETGAERGCLERRRWEGGVFLLNQDDAFWTLLAGLLLDHPAGQALPASPDPLAFGRLERLAVEARTDSPMARLLGGFLPAGWEPQHLVDCVWEGEWDVLARLAPKIEAGWLASRTWAARRRAAGARFAARMGARRLLGGWLSGCRGLSVALLAPDPTLKGVLAHDLGETFYLPVSYIRMGVGPRRGTRSQRLVRAGFVRTLTTFWRRWAAGSVRRAKGRLVLFDRYTYDARIPPLSPLRGLSRLRRVVLGRACPAPDLAVILDAPAALRPRRTRGPGGAEVPFALRRRQYLDLALRLPDALCVEAGSGGDRLRREVTAQLWRAYAALPAPAWLRCARRFVRPWRSGR